MNWPLLGYVKMEAAGELFVRRYMTGTRLPHLLQKLGVQRRSNLADAF
jgi:hypothetical protein